MPALTIERSSRRRVETSATEEQQAVTPSGKLFLCKDSAAIHDIVADYASTYAIVEPTETRGNATVAACAIGVVGAQGIAGLAITAEPLNSGTLGNRKDLDRPTQEYLVKVTADPFEVKPVAARPVFTDLGVEERPLLEIEAPIKRTYTVSIVGRARAQYRAGYKFPDDYR